MFGNTQGYALGPVTKAGPGSISAAPGFVDAANGDFRLGRIATGQLVDSPCIAGYIWLGQQLEQDHGACPQISGLIETATASVGRLDHRRASARREEIGKEATRAWPPVPWACAATQLAEAERLIGEQK